jgi:hypothetical protein
MFKKSIGTENRINAIDESSIVISDGSENANFMSSPFLFYNGIFDLFRYPHPTSRSILLEVTLIRAPYFIFPAMNLLM